MAVHLFTKRTILRPLQNVNVIHYSSFMKELEYKKYYKILEITEDCDQEEIRSAYLRLVKRFHPDSGTDEANADRFQEIDKAFRALICKKSRERWNVEEIQIEEQDIKHTAPQHRQYLSYDGIGSGNPFQRQKQYSKVRAMKAADNVYQHRVEKVTADEKALLDKVPLKHKIKTKYGYERLVEDLIQESMSKGEFNNLPGCGKPLPDHHSRNPYVDFVTHKLNEILIDNGFTPEWIMLQKEIRDEARQLRESLLIERQYFGPFPLDVDENIEWSEVVFKYNSIVEKINKKIAKFNLLVPVLDKQMMQINICNEAQMCLVRGKSFEDLGYERPPKKSELKSENNTKNELTVTIFGFLDQLFKIK